MTACSDFQATFQPDRRLLLKAGAAGFFGLNLPTLLRSSRASLVAPKAKHVLFLHQFGGPSHIDTFDMKPGARKAFAANLSRSRRVCRACRSASICQTLPRCSAASLKSDRCITG